MDQLPYIAGKFRKTNNFVSLKAPWDDSEVAKVWQCDKADVEEAIAAAAATAKTCRKLSTYDRAEVCRNVARGLQAIHEELSQIVCVESGKPIADARGEVDRAIFTFETAASEVERLGGEMMPLDLKPYSLGRFGITKRFPVGPVSAISPFNFPINLAVHKVAPALAVGCPVVLKPAPQTPGACSKLAEIIDKTAWPKGAFSVVPCDPDVADALVTDDRMKLLSFTGSPAVGWELKKRAGKKKVVLELGSNAAVILDESADLDFAIPRLVYGSYSYSGQKCISVQRIYAHEKIYDTFVKKFIEASRKAKVGDPRDPEVLVGPLVNKAAADRVETWLKEATDRGAEILLGGPRKGNVIPPTILAKVPADARISCQEVFAPVVAVEPFSDFSDALRRVDNSSFGLQAGVFTESIDRALEAFDELEMGAIILNDMPAYRLDPMPYGGVKDSGFGREGLRSSMEEMTELRMLVVNRLHHST